MYLLRAKQIGLTFEDMDQIDIGLVMDMMIEMDNDTYQYPDVASQSDIDRLLG